MPLPEGNESGVRTALLDDRREALSHDRELFDHLAEVPSHHPRHCGACVGRDARVAALVFEQACLAEVLPRPDSSHELKVAMHVDLTIEDDEEPVGEVPLAGESFSRMEFALLEPGQACGHVSLW